MTARDTTNETVDETRPETEETEETEETVTVTETRDRKQEDGGEGLEAEDPPCNEQKTSEEPQGQQLQHAHAHPDQGPDEPRASLQPPGPPLPHNTSPEALVQTQDSTDTQDPTDAQDPLQPTDQPHIVTATTTTSPTSGPGGRTREPAMKRGSKTGVPGEEGMRMSGSEDSLEDPQDTHRQDPDPD